MRGVCGSRSHWLATVSALALLLGRAPAQAQTAAAAPSGLTASAASSSQVNLTWTDNSDNQFAFAASRQGGGAAFARVAALAANTTRFTDSGLTPGATYTYEVRSINDAGASPWSNQATVALVPPAAPSNLAVSSLSAAVALTWTDNSNNEIAFAIWRQGGGADWARVGVVGPNTTAYTDTTASAGVSYNYRVRAINAVGASDWSNVVAVTTPSRPTAPTGLVTTALSGSQVTLAWTDNSNNEIAFAIWRQGGGAGWARVGVVGPDTTAYTDTNISANTTYTYQVRAINSAGASDWSNQVTAATRVPRPDHVVMVIEENHSYPQIIGNPAAPYINSLAQQGALFTASLGVDHPSQPNYLALFSGSTQGVTDNACPDRFTAPNLASELIAAGLTFGGYSEDMPSVGYTGCSSLAYRRKHNPWVDWQGVEVPATVNMPYTSFPANFSTLPTVAM